MTTEELFTVLAALTAVVAAARSTWSPCGLSMLSSITPFGERSRGNRYWLTAAWFVAGAAAGGATLGAFAALGALAVSAAGLTSHPAAVASIACVVAVLGATVDAGVFGPVMPVIRRQVDDRWLSRFRSWVYATGFGWQIGTGVLTYVMTSAVGLVVLLCVLTGEPWVAFGVTTGFGTARGTAVLLTSRAGDPRSLRVLHRKLDRANQPVRWAAVSVQALVAAASLVYVAPVALPVVLLVVAIAGIPLRRGRRAPAPARAADG